MNTEGVGYAGSGGVGKRARSRVADARVRLGMQNAVVGGRFRRGYVIGNLLWTRFGLGWRPRKWRKTRRLRGGVSGPVIPERRAYRRRSCVTGGDSRAYAAPELPKNLTSVRPSSPRSVRSWRSRAFGTRAVCMDLEYRFTSKEIVKFHKHQLIKSWNTAIYIPN